MKTLTAIAGLLLVSITVKAQDLDRPQLRLKPSNKKLDLNYGRQDSSSGIVSPLEKPGGRYSLFPKAPNNKPIQAETTQLQGQMPTLKPDSTIQFPMLAARPDSTIAFTMPVIKP